MIQEDAPTHPVRKWLWANRKNQTWLAHKCGVLPAAISRSITVYCTWEMAGKISKVTGIDRGKIVSAKVDRPYYVGRRASRRERT